MKQIELVLVKVKYPANFTFRQDAANLVSLAQVKLLVVLELVHRRIIGQVTQG